jgi:mRNA interferase MazF
MSYKFGDIVILDYPFTDGVTSKRRPGLVLIPEDDGDILFARITSTERAGAFEVALQDWRDEGLLHPSVVRLSKLVSLESALVEKHIGALSQRDTTAILAGLRIILLSIPQAREA